MPRERGHRGHRRGWCEHMVEDEWAYLEGPIDIEDLCLSCRRSASCTCEVQTLEELVHVNRTTELTYLLWSFFTSTLTALFSFILALTCTWFCHAC